MGDKMKYLDPKTGKVREGRLVVKPGREKEAESLRAAGQAAVQAGYERYKRMR
ncbi:hypothetical protein N5079_19885 [Planotetraspora sp. A-T 1434]|uniref:hypothetical protein n=1 Tax=Planotetraspora sp. A-T 1434 TaxID=2979219 RepID=UPI0021C00E29|nr:hypothetical protein [Planotetraspora sp. A-T 1434]MCT9932466.1 hypothetical protein [Planotetraspora sp. A-T 1434]